MQPIWLAHYPPGVPAEIDPGAYASVVAMLEESFARYRERDAFVFMDKTMTYGELDQRSRALAAWLQAQGLARGARVALMMPNVLQYPVAIAAVLRAGFTVVNVNPLYTPRELAFQLKDSGAEAIVVLENFAATVQQALPGTAVKHVVVAAMGDLLGRVKGAIVNLVVRRVKKMVPAYAIAGATRFNDALAAGGRMVLQPA
ncbi:MAG TPA: AMP-binding protein, partial [Xanthobacteraceae bacterium]